MIKIVEKSFPHADKDNVQGEKFLVDADTSSEVKNLGKLLNSADSGHSVRDAKVRLTGPDQMQLSELGENPATVCVPAHVRYCNTVSKMQLRNLYPSEAISHPKNRIWPVPVWRRIGHFQWDDPGSIAHRRSPHR